MRQMVFDVLTWSGVLAVMLSLDRLWHQSRFFCMTSRWIKLMATRFTNCASC